MNEELIDLTHQTLKFFSTEKKQSEKYLCVANGIATLNAKFFKTLAYQS